MLNYQNKQTKQQMKNTLKSVLTLVLVAGLGFVANAQTVENAQVTASAEILAALDIVKVTDVDFGNISSTTVGTVTLGANGTGNAYVGTTAQTGLFTIAGAENQSILVTYPAEVTLSNGTDDLFWGLSIFGNDENTQGTSTAIAAGGDDITTATTAVGGIVYWLYVGGTLYEATGAPGPLTGILTTGIYTGSATVTVEYN
jgi:hypothetical protein